MRTNEVLAYIILSAVGILGPVFFENYIQQIAVLWIMVLMASTWDITGGQMGYNSLGNITFFGAGMYISAVVQISRGYDVAEYTAAFGAIKVDFTDTQYFSGIALGIIAGGIGAFLIAILFGTAVFGLRGPYFAIGTYGVPMVEAEGASRSLFTQGYQYLFAVLSTSEQYLSPSIDHAASMAKKNGKNPSSVKVAMAFENDPFSLDVREGVVDTAKKYGMKIVIDDKLPADLSDMSATLTKVKALRPDILLVSGHSKGAATAARQIGEMRINVPLISITHCEAAKVHEKFPKAAQGFLCPTQWSPNVPYSDSHFGDSKKYDREFKAAYPSYSAIPYQTAQASAAVLVWKLAFEAANSFDKDRLRDAISATQTETFYGKIKFSEAGNNIAKPMLMRQISGKKYADVVSANDLAWPRKVSY